MKRILALAVATVLFASCGLHAPPEWDDTPNPLDTPATEVFVPEASGDFGPGWMDRR